MARTTTDVKEAEPTRGTIHRQSTGRHGLPTGIRAEASIDARLESTDEVVLKSLDEASRYLRRELMSSGASTQERRQIVGRFESAYYNNLGLYSDPKALLELVKGTLREYEGR